MKSLLIILLALGVTQGLRAQILSEALLVFPAQTEALEYDNLAALRALPNYSALRQKFSGKPLEQVKATLSQLGVSEEQVRELVVGSSPSAFYGLLGGTFSGAAAAKNAIKKGMAPVMIDGSQLFCSADATCVVFMEDSMAAFGTSGQLKTMLDARQGFIARLSSKTALVYLVNRLNKRAPVQGIASGSLLSSSIADALQDQSGLNLDWSQVSSNISAFGYSVMLDSKAHVSATLECKSQATAALLKQMLGALGGLQSVAAQAGKTTASMPFENMQVSSSGSIIDLKMDTPVPTA